MRTLSVPRSRLSRKLNSVAVGKTQVDVNVHRGSSNCSANGQFIRSRVGVGAKVSRLGVSRINGTPSTR